VIGVLASGEGTNLQALLDAGLPVVAVASNRAGCRALDRAEAAGVETAAFPLDEFADREQRDATMANWLQEQGVRLVVCAGYMHLLTPGFLERFPGRVVNVHLVDEGLDTGPVVRQVPVPVEPRETLVERIHAVEHRLLPEVVRELCAR
jgi:phosphoribosylglycinamide formyltransferase 1